MIDHNAALYPFLYSSAPPADDAALLDAVYRSTLEKGADVLALRRALLEEYAGLMVDAAAAMADAFAAGGRLLAFGNGGSATDALDAIADCMAPTGGGGRPLPALALLDASIVTALANDVGTEQVFARQVIAYGEAGDIALAVSTSGNSPNVRAGLREARRRGLLTIALTGDNGGGIAADGDARFCFIARTQHIPRTQEGHAAVWHTLLELTRAMLAERAEGGPA